MQNLLLGLNTATNILELCIIDIDSKKLIASSNMARSNNESELLMPSIAKLFEQNKLKLSDLKQVFVISGPGSFVAVRLGVLIANSLVQNLEKTELYSMNTFEFMAQNEAEIVVLFAGGNSVYVYDCQDKKHSIQDLNDELKAKLKQKKVIADLKNPEIENELNNISKKSLDSVIMDLIADNSLEQYRVYEFPLEVNYVKEPSIQV